ncbi:MAG: RimK family alpha-L-glutamate ligase [Candidatus Bathyarchaeota archaeon]|nr:RimK family alpha-L-glutamate ligase [Candidatus Bathyarchaeota archaeon]
MIVGILGKDVEGWGTVQLRESLKRRDASFVFFSFPSLVAKVGYRCAVGVNDIDVARDLPALIIRHVGRGSLEEIIFRMDLLHSLERRGVLVVNPAGAIERCVDKYYALALLDESGLPVPRTVVTESVEEALVGFHELGGDVVLKPLFGSQGVGSTRIFDADVAARIFSSIRFYHGVLYLQEFVPHGDSDIRAFVVGDRVVAAMRRVGDSWKTNVSQGARPVAIQISEELEALAVKAAKVVDCRVAGVDILESKDGPLIIEVNSQPGWRGLQSVTQVDIADCIVDYVLSEVKRR